MKGFFKMESLAENPESYEGTTANGITTSAYGSYKVSGSSLLSYLLSYFYLFLFIFFIFLLFFFIFVSILFNSVFILCAFVSRVGSASVGEY
jgi:hypothetical protein